MPSTCNIVAVQRFEMETASPITKSLSRDRMWDGQIARPCPSGYCLVRSQMRHI